MSVPLENLTVLRYQEIIDGVVGRVKPSFNEEGIDESVLDEVRALWEAKLVATGVVGEPSIEGQQVILQQRLQQVPLRAAGLPLAPATLPHQLQPLHAAHPQFLAMRPGFHPGVPGMGMQQMLVPGAVPQQLNMAAFAVMQAQAHAAMVEQKRKLDAEAATEAPDAKLQRTIPQQDGPADDAGHEIAEGEAQGTVAAAAEAKEEEGKEDDDDPLSEDDDDGSGDEVDEASLANVVLGQFEKVQRSKSKWKVVLKDCILTLNGRDYLVRRCTGEMDF